MMRNLTTAVVVAATSMCAGLPAVAAPDRSIVNGTISWGSQTVVMSAQTVGADTTQARGDWSFFDGNAYAGTVSTLVVDGGKAMACGTITSSSDPAMVGRSFWQYVHDIGNGSSHGTGDFSQSGVGSLPFAGCVIPGITGLENTSGNWTVMP